MNNEFLLEQHKNNHLYFKVGNIQYAVNANSVLEIIKLPQLDYPQQMPNNIVGLMKYNNFVINVVDIRFYLNIQPVPYSTSNEVLIIKTDDAIIGIIVDNVEGILPFASSNIDSLPFVDNKTLIDSLYKLNDETIFIINQFSLENIIKEPRAIEPFDVQSLFPSDKASREILHKRQLQLVEKEKFQFVHEIYTKDKYISFFLNNNCYGIKLQYIKEVLRDTTISNVPCTPDFIKGIMNLRGDFITVLDLKQFLGMDASSNKEEKRPLIIVENEGLTLALQIDKIHELFEIPDEAVSKNNESSLSFDIIHNNRFFTILNIDKLSQDKRLFITDM